MHNRFLGERTALDINARVAKLLKDLGNPQPPLRLEMVRELLSLDRAYYSATDSGVLAETVHRLKMAGKQVLLRPALLLDVVKKLELKALWIPDRKRILIDAELPPAKQRWGEAHEIGHSLLPWHEAVMHGDRKRTLSLTCEQHIEAEANYAGGRLLFLQDLFTEQLRGRPLTFQNVKQLSTVFGNTMTSTLWRAIESTNEPVFGLVSQHPMQVLGQEPLRYFIRSREFERQFASVSAHTVFVSLQRFCRPGRGPLGEAEVIFSDSAGVDHVFHLETFYNSYEALTLGKYIRIRSLSVSC